ncbi:MAG TPA: alpha/beta hydrolase [Phaeodactylibacter sp.]|nr:alpha/beta hydrolase [Phaeodactylibacter sp.]
MKVLKILIGLLVLLVGGYFLGPQPDPPVLQAERYKIDIELSALADSIRAAEAAVPHLKPNNEARILWADSIPQRTPYCLVYLPGFTATYVEGEPIHREFAERYGCNLYVPRWRDHGLEVEDKLLHYHPDSVLETAAHALAVGQRLGEKVILMSTSTGGTLSLLLAGQLPDQVDGLIAFSPNIAIDDGSAALLNGPWGLQIARQMLGGKFRSFEAEAEFKKYWYNRYRIEGLVQLQNLVEHGMRPELFGSVEAPFFLGYYYKNEQEKDHVVSVVAMLEMYKQLGTPDSLKRKVAFPNVANHALASYVGSKDLESVREAVFDFTESVLKLQPLE